MNILQVYWKFEHFGNEGWIPNSPGSYDSLESLHDQIHGLVGNGGHMAIVSSTATYFRSTFLRLTLNVALDRLFRIRPHLLVTSYQRGSPVRYLAGSLP